MPSGKVYKYGDNVDTDVIIPARYLNAPSPDELAKHCMEDIDATFAQKVQPGDIIVGGANFGCGSSREHAPIAIRACGVSCVIAPSFALPSIAVPTAAMRNGGPGFTQKVSIRAAVLRGSEPTAAASLMHLAAAG